MESTNHSFHHFTMSFKTHLFGSFFKSMVILNRIFILYLYFHTLFLINLFIIFFFLSLYTRLHICMVRMPLQSQYEDLEIWQEEWSTSRYTSQMRSTTDSPFLDTNLGHFAFSIEVTGATIFSIVFWVKLEYLFLFYFS